MNREQSMEMKEQKKLDKIQCERCGEILNPKTVKWLELSNTDGRYYPSIPDDHISQGLFSFGRACAKTQLKEDYGNS